MQEDRDETEALADVICPLVHLRNKHHSDLGVLNGTFPWSSVIMKSLGPDERSLRVTGRT